MGIKSYRPETAGLRHRTSLTYEELTTSRPYKPLLKYLPKSGGRDSRGHLSIRHRGGGHKKMFRILDFYANFAINEAALPVVKGS